MFLRILFSTLLIALWSGPSRADDGAVWDALKKGGKVVLLRHPHVDIREGIGVLAPGNCAAEVNLSERGIEQAKQIGDAFRQHSIPIGTVLTSPFCRCIDSGTIAFGRATVADYLRPPGTVSDEQGKANDEQLLKLILAHHDASNLIVITHDLNIANIVLEPVAMGDFFVVEPNGNDVEIIGKVRIGEP